MTTVSDRYIKGPSVELERVFKAPVERVWAMWTTRAGLEKWYWPVPLVGRVVHLDVRAGGSYEIAAEGLEHTSRGTYTEVKERELLVMMARIDFLSEVEAYDRTDVVEFHPLPGNAGTKMLFTSTPMHAAVWQERSTKGFWSSLDKLERALAEEA